MKKEVETKWIQGKYGLFVLLILLLLIFSKNLFVQSLLRYYGVQTNAVVIDKTIRETRAGSSTLLYSFKVDEENYEGNTSKTDPTRNIVSSPKNSTI